MSLGLSPFKFSILNDYHSKCRTNIRESSDAIGNRILHFIFILSLYFCDYVIGTVGKVHFLDIGNRSQLIERFSLAAKFNVDQHENHGSQYDVLNQKPSTLVKEFRSDTEVFSCTTRSQTMIPAFSNVPTYRTHHKMAQSKRITSRKT